VRAGLLTGPPGVLDLDASLSSTASSVAMPLPDAHLLEQRRPVRSRYSDTGISSLARIKLQSLTSVPPGFKTTGPPTQPLGNPLFWPCHQRNVHARQAPVKRLARIYGIFIFVG